MTTDLPDSMAADAARRSDVRFDTADPVLGFGRGIATANRLAVVDVTDAARPTVARDNRPSGEVTEFGRGLYTSTFTGAVG